MLLQAKKCDLAPLRGLPMLRPLDPALVGRKYDADFLREHCAVCDTGGKAESLYIALQHDTLSWRFLRGCWEYDELLDRVNPAADDSDGVDDGDRPSAGAIVPNGLGSMRKRDASQISRASSFGSSVSTESEGSHPKIPRTCLPGLVDVPRRAEKV